MGEYLKAQYDKLLEKGENKMKKRKTEVTRCQKEVLKRIAEGMSNHDIALDLGVCDQTVKMHVSALIKRFGAKNRVQVLVRALKEGIL